MTGLQTGRLPHAIELTLEEKVSLTLGTDFWRTGQVVRAGIPAMLLSDGPHGIRHKSPTDDPAGVSANKPATCFPTAGALGCSFDPELARRVGGAIGAEAGAAGIRIVLGPGINIKRSPLCGRNFEYFSEDPHVSGVLGEAWVVGLQGQGVGASVKHFAAYNQETDRLRVDVIADERTLREIYLPAFERVVIRARPWTVMCSYNKLNGLYTSENAWLLSTVLRDDWGFDGVVVSDWGAIHDRVKALLAGIDLAMPPAHGQHDRDVTQAVLDGRLQPQILDKSVSRLLSLVDKPETSPTAYVIDYTAHHSLAREAARAGIVLLKNESDVLPLDLAPGQTLAVIGELARNPRIQGGGSSQVTPTRVDVPLEELEAGLPAYADLVFAPGYATNGDEAPHLRSEALAAAEAADVVVVFAGLAAETDCEGMDRDDLSLPSEQVELLNEISQRTKQLVVVLSGGSIVNLGRWHDRASALLHSWLGGQAIGGALADVLLGRQSPGGRLAESWPQRYDDLPVALNFPGEQGTVTYGERMFVGYRGLDQLERPVAYPFGHGLTYGQFEYSDLTVALEGSVCTEDLRITVKCQVANTGRRTATEIVQVYVADLAASVSRPPQELRAFSKVVLEPGDATLVHHDLSARDLAFWSAAHSDWLVETGEFQISVGASSRDLRLQAVVRVDAPERRNPLGTASTVKEWLNDPHGVDALLALVDKDAQGNPVGLLGDRELMRVLSEFPLKTLAAFPGLGLDHDLIREALGRVHERSSD